MSAYLGVPGEFSVPTLSLPSRYSIMFGRQTSARGPAPDFRWYWAAVGFEFVAIIIAVWWLGRVDRPDYILPVISVIVGIHFFGLVPAFHSLRFFWIGLVMFLLPIFAILLLPSELRDQVSVRSLVVGVGCALTLWLGALL